MQPIYQAFGGIQIDITNFCTKKCLYCSRYNRHYRPEQRAHMPIEMFSKALWALEEWPKHLWIGIIGGEPLLHPQLEEICYEIMPFRHATGHRIGLWTSSIKIHTELSELVNRTFDFIIVNEHSKEQLEKCRHQPLTISISEVIEDQQLCRKLIDNCWVPRMWCATVNHKGAYFCEVAAAMDVLLNDGGNAWPVEKNWWKRDPREFEEQIKACCYNCGMPIPMEREAIVRTREKFSPKLLTRFQERGLRCISDKEVEIFDRKLTAEEIAANAATWNPMNYREDVFSGDYYSRLTGIPSVVDIE